MIESSHTPPTTMSPGRKHRLRLHLAAVIVIKIVLLTLLWHAFIKPNKVSIDITSMGERIAGTQTGNPKTIPTLPGDKK